jgi:hypothetical protein
MVKTAGPIAAWLRKAMKGGLGRFLARRTRTPEKELDVNGRLLLERWTNCMAMSLFGSANLVRLGPCLDGRTILGCYHRNSDRSDSALRFSSRVGKTHRARQAVFEL